MVSRIFSHQVNGELDCGLWGDFDFSFFFLLFDTRSLSRALQVYLRSFVVSHLRFCQRASAYVEKVWANSYVSTWAVDQ